MKESDVVARLKKLGPAWRVYRFGGGRYQPRGVPDVCLTSPDGDVVFVEIKIGQMPVTPLQLAFLDGLKFGYLLRIDDAAKVLTWGYFNAETIEGMIPVLSSWATLILKGALGWYVTFKKENA